MSTLKKWNELTVKGKRQRINRLAPYLPTLVDGAVYTVVASVYNNNSKSEVNLDTIRRILYERGDSYIKGVLE